MEDKQTKNIKSISQETWLKFFRRDMTIGELYPILEIFKNESYFYTSSLKVICKHFLSYVLNDKEIFIKSFEEIFILSLGLIDDEELLEEFPKTEYEFYSYIADRYLRLIKEPRQAILELYDEASLDLKVIGENQKKIKAKIEDAKNLNNRGESYLSSKYKYEIDKLEYYKIKNNEAEESIIRFLSEEIKTFAYNECSKFSLITNISIFARPTPYSFSRRNPFFAHRYRNSYDPDNFSILKNKFLRLGIKKYDKIISEHINSKINDNELMKFSTKYIRENDLINELLSKIEKNHILQKRRELLLKIIAHYQNSDHLSVYYMTPPQIEGIFFDYCIEIGIPEKEIHKSSISSKLEKLRAKFNFSILYEYFTFYFPVIRNKVAHGAILDEDFEFQATMLILDLFSVCDLAFSENFDINKSLGLITTIIEYNSLEDLYSWIDYLDSEHSPIYQLDDKIHEIESRYESKEFWNFIYNIRDSENENEIREKIIKLKGKNIAEGKCEEFLKK